MSLAVNHCLGYYNRNLQPNQTCHCFSPSTYTLGTTNENFVRYGNPISEICTTLALKSKRKMDKEKGSVMLNSPTCAVQTEKSGVISREESGIFKVKLQTLDGCKLGIGRYPDFEYNAGGGGGDGIVQKDLSSENFVVEFDIENLYIPALTHRTTKFLGLPLPSFLSISIVPDTFKGFIEQHTGKVELNFRANFYFAMLSLYKPPPLLVETVLTTEEVEGELRNARGQRLNSDGFCKLVGVATVVPINDYFLNTFLNLPTECLAAMSVKILIMS